MMGAIKSNEITAYVFFLGGAALIGYHTSGFVTVGVALCFYGWNIIQTYHIEALKVAFREHKANGHNHHESTEGES